jgi:hypothetical protein
MKYSGIDLHSNNSVVTVTDEEDRVVAEKRLPNDLAKILGFLLPWREELAGVVVESTFNWYWLVDGLQAAGVKVHLANTTAIKKYEGLKTAVTKRMPVTSPTCCGWGFCQLEPSCRRSSALFAIWRGSGCNWCEVAPLTSSPSRTSPPASTAPESAAIRSSA